MVRWWEKTNIQLSIFFLFCIHAALFYTRAALFACWLYNSNPEADLYSSKPIANLRSSIAQSAPAVIAPYYTPRQVLGFQDPPNSDREVTKALEIVNIPTQATWNLGGSQTADFVPQQEKSFSIDFGYVYNPSILELGTGEFIFAARMSVLYAGRCGRYQHDNHAMKHCLLAFRSTFMDQTVFGEYHPTRNTLEISPSELTTPNIETEQKKKKNNKKNKHLPLNNGREWFDTRLLYPYNHRYSPKDPTMHSNENKNILVTSQTTVLLRNEDWDELQDESTLALQLTYLSVYEGLDSFSKMQMIPFYFFDKDRERNEWRKRLLGETWTPMVEDVARLQCPFKSFPPLPTLEDFPDNQEEAQEALRHRRLAALEGDSWVTIKDKNWAPFAVQDRLLWSYSIFPNHVVCENDVPTSRLTKTIQDKEEEDVDCVLCIKQYESMSTSLFEAFTHRLKEQEGVDRVNYHLNGVPAYYVEELDSYVGVFHVIKTKLFTESPQTRGFEPRQRVYEHYLYRMEANAPFQIVELSSHRIPLERSYCWSPWFDADDDVLVEFVMSMQYHPDRDGHEFVLSYGDGDHLSRTLTLSLSQVRALFS